jgi:glycosyltransferase involved in cell wall biosynthesis
MPRAFDPRVILAVARVLRRAAPDIVHMHTARAHSLGVPASILARTGRRIVSRRVDFVPGRLSARVKYRYGVDRFIAITEAVASVLRGVGVDPDRIAVVPSGIDPSRVASGDRTRMRCEWKLPDGARVVGTIAHFAWHKGLPDLIRAWPIVRAAASDAVLVLVGEGEDERSLRSEVAAAGVGSSVVFAGFRRDIADCLAAFDVFVLPSHLEGMGTSLLDALAAGKPVVASAVGGIPEIVAHGETGLLVPPRSPTEIAAAILLLLSDDAYARSLAERGRSRVLASFTAASMVAGTVREYETALASGG